MKLCVKNLNLNLECWSKNKMSLRPPWKTYKTCETDKKIFITNCILYVCSSIATESCDLYLTRYGCCWKGGIWVSAGRGSCRSFWSRCRRTRSCRTGSTSHPSSRSSGFYNLEQNYQITKLKSKLQKLEIFTSSVKQSALHEKVICRLFFFQSDCSFLVKWINVKIIFFS